MSKYSDQTVLNNIQKLKLDSMSTWFVALLNYLNFILIMMT